MAIDDRYRMKIVRSLRSLKEQTRPRRGPKVNVKPTTAQIVRAFKRLRGYDEIVAQIPDVRTADGWGTRVAYFSTCAKSGSALCLDLWDCDHFDGTSDMRRALTDCRAWFSHSSNPTWGSAQTATGRINCFFNAATRGSYACVAHLLSDPSGSRSTVECLIDNDSFGPLSFSGTIVQPHFGILSAGNHHFRIRQVTGAFYFLSVGIYSFGSEI
jgi:hypothetical protein